MNIDILAVGDIKEGYLREGIEEYEKRLRPYAKLRIIEIGEERIGSKPSARDIEIKMEKEGKKILDKISDRAYVISLVIEGKQASSKAFAKRIENIGLMGYGDIAFVIGGSNGLSPQVKARSDLKLSFSRMTFPHQLMRLILLEQVYRAYKIINNEPYHK